MVGGVQSLFEGEMEEKARQKNVMVQMVQSSASCEKQRLWDWELSHEDLDQY